MSTSSPWALIVGEGHEGRNEVVRALSRGLRRRGLEVAGAYQEPAQDEAGATIGYDLLELPGGERHPLARLSNAPDLCGYAFDPSIFEALNRRLDAASADVVFLPAHKLEAGGEGYRPAIDAALARGSGLLVLSIRRHLLARLVLTLPDPALHLELPAAAGERDRFEGALAELALARRRSTTL